MTELMDCPVIGIQEGNRAANRRRKVIDAARLLFSDNGFHATGMAELAKRSEIAIGQIYRDFAGKEEIVAAIVAADCAIFTAADALHDAVARGDRDSVRDWIHAFVDPQEKGDSRMFAEILAESSRNERIAAIFTGVQAAAHANVVTALGLFAPGPAMAERRSILGDTILTLSMGLMHHRLMHCDVELARLVASLVRLVDREIAALECAAVDGG